MKTKKDDNKADVQSLEDVLKLQEKVKQFEELLSDIENLSDKKKALWKEIYENAITDRVNAYMLFVTLHNIVKNAGATEHAIHGPQLAKYLEKMHKATDQLIKLADLIAAEEKANSGFDENEIFNSSRKMKG